MVEMSIERFKNGQWFFEVEVLDTENDFLIKEDSLNQEICCMGQKLVRYGTLAAEQSANLKRKEENVKHIHARLAGAYRSQAELEGTRMTEGKLQEQVIVDTQYQQALGELHLQRAESLKADHYWRSITQVSSLLNALAFRQSAEIKRMG